MFLFYNQGHGVTRGDLLSLLRVPLEKLAERVLNPWSLFTGAY